MNGIEKITSQIIADAEKYEKKVRENCLEQCDIARNTEKERADAVCEEERKKCDIECAGVAERAISSAKVIERNILLDAKNARIDGIFKLARERLEDLDEEVYLSFLEKNLKKAVELLNAPEEDGFGYDGADTGIYTLILNKNDKAEFGEKLLKNTEDLISGRACSMVLSDKCAEICGGFILSRCERELDCSFETLLREASQTMRQEINAILFG